MLQKWFGDKTFWRGLLSLALPIAVQNLLTSSFTLVDTLMVGQLGDVSLAAVGMAGQWSWLLNMVLFGISSGASVFFSQFYGDGNKKGFLHTYGIALATGTVLSVLFMLVGYLVPRGVISIFNRDAAELAAGAKYLQIAVFSYPAIMLNMLVNVVLRSTRRVKLPMVVAFFTTILNAILDYGLIFGAFGLPEFGISGAAIATVISAWSGPAIIFAVCAFAKDDIFFAPIKELFGFSKSFVVEFFRRALPVVFNETLWGLGTVVYNIIFGNMGYEYTAAISVLRTFENIAFAFFIGMNNAACVMIGQDIGSGNIRNAITKSTRFMFIVPAAGLVAGVLIVLFREQLIGIFNIGGTITEKTLQAARGIMLVYAIELAIRNVPYISIVGIFRSGGDTKKGMKYDLLSLWLISVPITFVAAFVLKLPFVAVFACSYICEDYLKTFLCIRYFKSKKWIQPVTESGKNGLKMYLQEEVEQKAHKKETCS